MIVAALVAHTGAAIALFVVLSAELRPALLSVARPAHALALEGGLRWLLLAYAATPRLTALPMAAAVLVAGRAQLALGAARANLAFGAGRANLAFGAGRANLAFGAGRANVACRANVAFGVGRADAGGRRWLGAGFAVLAAESVVRASAALAGSRPVTPAMWVARLRPPAHIASAGATLVLAGCCWAKALAEARAVARGSAEGADVWDVQDAAARLGWTAALSLGIAHVTAPLAVAFVLRLG